MRNSEEFSSSSRDRHQKKSTVYKIDNSETKEERVDLRNRLNELKKTNSKDHFSQRDRTSSSASSTNYHRTKQIHDYEPYHKSSVISSTVTANNTSIRSSNNHHRLSQNSPDSRLSKKNLEERDKSSYKHISSRYSNELNNFKKSEYSSKSAKIIKDAEVTEIVSEEEDKTSESEVSSNEAKGKESGASSGSESTSFTSETPNKTRNKSLKNSQSRSKSVSRSPLSNDEKMNESDLESREAKMKARLKEKFLKDQLDKKYKELVRKPKKVLRKPKSSDSQNQSCSSSITNEASVRSHKYDSNDESSRSSKRNRNNENESSQSSDGREKFSKSDSNRSYESEDSDQDSKENSKFLNQCKKRKSDETEIIADYESEDGSFRSESGKANKKECDQTFVEKIVNEESLDVVSVNVEQLIQPPPTVITYYCATQGCRSVEEFECLNKIEEGTFGVVYRAKDKKSNEVVALKRLKMEKEREGFPITSIREVDTLLKSQHINVVKVREIVVGSNMDKIYMVMDYVEHDLKSLMQHSMKKPFQMSEVKCLTKQMLAGIAHLHDNWIIHRDLKTSNLLLSHKGILKIADFGLAREYGSPLKEYTPVVVTLWYRCPELLLATKKYSTSVDMWSVGTIFGELMLLKALFPGKNEKDQLDKIFKDLGTPNEKIWPGFKDLPLTKKMNFPDFPYNTLRSRFGNYLSENGFELINKLLTYDPIRRISAEDAMKHEFFRESPLPVDPSIFPTWPAKSEGISKAKKVNDSEPRAPSAGKMYEQLIQDDNSFVLQFPAISAGFTLR